MQMQGLPGYFDGEHDQGGRHLHPDRGSLMPPQAVAALGVAEPQTQLLRCSREPERLPARPWQLSEGQGHRLPIIFRQQAGSKMGPSSETQAGSASCTPQAQGTDHLYQQQPSSAQSAHCSHHHQLQFKHSFRTSVEKGPR